MKLRSICLYLGLALAVSEAMTSAAQTASEIHPFNGTADGAQPSSLIQAQDGNYYGTTSYGGSSQGNGKCIVETTDVGCGTIFQMSVNNGSATVTPLYSFTGGSDGGVPTSIIQGPDGNLYGTTAFGGASLTANTACIDGNGGNNGAVDPDHGDPEPCCVDSSGTNNIGCGTLFKISPSQLPPPGQISILVNFDGPTDGAFPSSLTAGLSTDGNKTPILYGISQACSYCQTSGSLFSFNPASDTFSPLSFGLSGFEYPNSLIQGECSNGASCDLNLYGTTQLGGDNCSSSNLFGCGGIFEYSVSTQKDAAICLIGESNSVTASVQPITKRMSVRTETVTRQSGVRFPFDLEWSFDSIPMSITESSDGSILGTNLWECFSSTYGVGSTCGSGTNDVATVFQCQPPPSNSTSWTLNTIYPFTNEIVPSGNVGGTTDGGGSVAGLILASDGNYYGSSGSGIFQITSTAMDAFLTSSPSSPPTQLANLNPFGLLPSGEGSNSMIQGSDGNFYGITASGGANGYGSIFEVAPSSTLSSPVQVSVSPAQIKMGSSATVSWTVPNAFSITAQQCNPFLQGGNGPVALTVTGQGSISNGAFTNSVSVSPTQAGTYTYAVTCGGTVSGSTATALTVIAELTFPASTLSNGVINQTYSGSVAASGGIGPYTYTLASGSSLPAGLMLNSSAGTITGEPTIPGSYSFSITVTDAESPAASVTTPFSMIVMEVTPSVVLTVLPNTGVVYDQSVTLTATESPVEGTAQGYSWTLNEDGQPLVSGALSTGSGTYAMSVSPAAGQHTFSATFSSNQNFYPPASSNSVSLSVAKATPSVNTWPTAGAITSGQTLASSTLTGGSASVEGAFAWTSPTTAPPVGNYPGSVTFTPTDSTDNNPVTGTAVVIVNPAPSFTLSPSPASISIAQGSSGTTTITVTSEGGFSGTVALVASGLPSGVTSSFAAGSSAGTEVLTLTASNSAQVTSSPITVTITGTSGTLSTTTSISLNITAGPSFTGGTGGATSLSLAPGATSGNTAAINIVGTNGFTGTVNLTCNVTTSISNVNDMPSCGLNPTSVALSGATAQTSTLTVTTTAATNAETNSGNFLWPAGGTALAVLLFFTVPRRRRHWLAITGILLLSVSIGALGCGGGGGNGGGGGGGGGNAGTTPGSYTITVTGTSGSVTATVATITLTVQ